MALAPDATSPTVPLYAYDADAGQWYRIGVGAHTHDDLLPVTGGTIAPGPLVVPGPTSLEAAARWSDGMPRFANAVARDAAYATIGGPQVGMSCFLLDSTDTQVWDGSKWAWMSRTTGSYILTWLGANYVFPVAGYNVIPMTAIGAGGLPHGTDFQFNGHIKILNDGLYHFGGSYIVGEVATGDWHTSQIWVYDAAGAVVDGAYILGGGEHAGYYCYTSGDFIRTLLAGWELRVNIHGGAGMILFASSIMWAERIA